MTLNVFLTHHRKSLQNFISIFVLLVLLASFLPAHELASATTYTIWGATGSPANTVGTDPGSIEVGVKFRSSVSGSITGIRFYRGSASTGPYSGHIWDISQNLLASVEFGTLTSSGWQEALFSVPVAISANTTYIASYFAPSGNYAFSPNFFTSSVDNPPLSALASGVDGPNGVYSYSPTSTFPNTSFNNANYWVDVIFETTGPTNPTVINRAPLPNSTAISLDTNVSVTFNEPMLPSSITNTSFTLRAQGAVIDVPASVSYSGMIATLDPTSPLQVNTLYQVTVAGTIQDLAGNPLGTTDSWSFRTSIFNNITDTTTVNFSAGSIDNTCAVDPTIGDGAVRLPAQNEESFAGTVLPTGWETHPWNSGTPTVGGGVLTVNGSEAYTTVAYGPGISLEFAATFTAQSFQHVGFGGSIPPFDTTPWIMFSTSASNNQLFARVDGTSEVIGAIDGIQHIYLINWKANSIGFYVDNVLKATIPATVTTPMPLAISDFLNDQPSLSVDWLRLTPPYSLTCIFTSQVIDVGQSVAWDNLSWAGSTTGLEIAYRLRNSDDSWPAFITATNPQGLSGSSQYVQYQATLTSTDANLTPALESVTFDYHITPTAANLNYFHTWKDPAGVQLSWETVSEATTAGFNLYRREPSGEFTLVNEALIPPLAGGQPQGAAYTYVDSGAAPGQRYEYRLEVLGTSLLVDADVLVTFWPYAVSLPLVRH